MPNAIGRVRGMLRSSGSRISELWFGQSVRSQVNVAVAVMLAIATLTAGGIAVVNGRQAVETEMRSSISFLERYVRAVVQRIRAEGRLNELEKLLAQEVSALRHAQVYIQRDGSEPELVEPGAAIADSADGEASEAAPAWFIALMMPTDTRFLQRYVYLNDARIALLISGFAKDEIYEKWNELSALAIIWFVVIALLLGGLHAILGRILDPLVEVSRRLTALEIGRRDQRVPVPRVKELAAIAETFNSLASSLDQTREENGTLYRQLMDIQEEERRIIANELHDEAGPCLFGITINAESIVRLLDALPSASAEKVRNRTDEILSISERLKTLNRALLRRLRPVSIGKVSITSLIRELIHDFERKYADVIFIAKLEVGAKSFGDTVDLTVYRCVQESLTNAIRHGNATNCVVSLTDEPSETPAAPLTIHLSIRDNGAGLKPGSELGFGLAAMRERILSAGGTWLVGPSWPQGVIVNVTIPAAEANQSNLLPTQPEKAAS